jgi:hypothetical protein
MSEERNRIAGPGHIFVCCACGKVSANQYGFIVVDGKPRSVASPNWDESCSLKAREFLLEHLEWNEDRTRVIRIHDTVFEPK